MYIENFKISNYKSYLNSDELMFKPGFNVIVGQNDVGKTALLEALSLQFLHNPHRSLQTLPHLHSAINAYSSVELSFKLDDDEANQLIARMGTNSFWVPIDDNNNVDVLSKKFSSSLTCSGHLVCKYMSGEFISSYLEKYGEYNSPLSIPFQVDPATQTISYIGGENTQTPFTSTYGWFLANQLRSNIYAFKAERLNIGESSLTNGSALLPNASNLPGVLNYLQSSNPSRFNELNRLLNIIFPHITQVTVPISPNSTGHARIYIWSIDPKSERSDLAVPLSECGTGIGQVLSILYILLTSSDPRTIIIDEPQSFLHPGAVRKLMSILKTYPQHQYIISTHSPNIVASTNPNNLLLVKKHDSESIVESLDSRDTKNISLLLSEVGARLSDVFGADNILWVEGRTEELCFPLIIEKLCNVPLLGTQIIGVKHTSDFEGKFAKTAFEIYERLSKGNALLPPALGFIFDRENRKEQDCTDLIRQGKDRVKFLSRKMYENYLLNTEALSAILCSSDFSDETQVTPEDIKTWLTTKGLDNEYINESVDSINDPKWLIKVDGAKLLSDMFSYLSNSRVQYDKITHGLDLTEWIIQNSPSDLDEISGLLKNYIN